MSTAGNRALAQARYNAQRIQSRRRKFHDVQAKKRGGGGTLEVRGKGGVEWVPRNTSIRLARDGLAIVSRPRTASTAHSFGPYLHVRPASVASRGALSASATSRSMTACGPPASPEGVSKPSSSFLVVLGGVNSSAGSRDWRRTSRSRRLPEPRRGRSARASVLWRTALWREPS